MAAFARSKMALLLALAGLSHYAMLRLNLAAGVKPAYGLAWRAGALSVIFVAVVMSQFAAYAHNTRASRLLHAACTVCYAALLGCISNSPWLVVGGAVPLLLMPNETNVRRFGYKGAYSTILAPVLAIVMFFLARPAHGWEWALVPIFLLGCFSVMGALAAPLALRKLGRDNWKVAIGQGAPEVKLPQIGTQVEWSLEGERGRFVLLCFLRGHWCAVCHIMMRIYKAEAPKLLAHGVKLVAVTPTGGPEAAEFARQIGVDYTVLIDEGNQLAQQFGALQPQAFQGKDAPLPASFLIDREGKVRYASRPKDVASFLDPREIIAILAGEPKPEMRAAS
jgi:peroxiredoxin